MGEVIVGEAMQRAVKYVRANPGATTRQISDHIAAGNNWSVVQRCLKAGLLRKVPEMTEEGYVKAWRFYVTE
ncbi:MAG TPA: hypothetical protein VHK27_05015 [Gammaproteobacteria bacterium]|nr:hypothetical protein [Gammaproteobacteria bacterium]